MKLKSKPRVKKSNHIKIVLKARNRKEAESMKKETKKMLRHMKHLLGKDISLSLIIHLPDSHLEEK